MHPQPLIDELLARVFEVRSGGGEDGLEVLPPEVQEHLRQDPSAASLWARWVRQVRGLAALPRREVPPDLEGRVVATFHAGHRQDRIASHLDRLPRLEAPKALEARVRHLAERPFSLPGIPAPSVLDRLVEADFDHSRAQVEGPGPAVSRGGSPSDARAAAHRAGVVRRLLRSRRVRSALRRPALESSLRRVAAAAAVFLVVLGLGRLLGGPQLPDGPRSEVAASGARAPRRAAVTFVLVDPGESPLLRNVLDSVGGGATGGLR